MRQSGGASPGPPATSGEGTCPRTMSRGPEREYCADPPDGRRSAELRRGTPWRLAGTAARFTGALLAGGGIAAAAAVALFAALCTLVFSPVAGPRRGRLVALRQDVAGFGPALRLAACPRGRRLAARADGASGRDPGRDRRREGS